MTMLPGVRKLALAVHLAVSIGWLGAAAAYIVLDATAATSRDVSTVRGAYLGMEVIARSAIVPFAIASLVTGLVVSLGTRWGLFRHWWVVVSLVLTTFATLVLVGETQTISYLAARAADPATSAEELRHLGNTLPHSIGGTVVLLIVLVLNVYKPQGLTPYGWRKRQEARRALRATTRVGETTLRVETAPRERN